MLFILSSPLLAFIACMYSVAIFGEFIVEDGMMTQEFICVWIVLVLVKIGGYLYTRRPRNHHPR